MIPYNPIPNGLERQKGRWDPALLRPLGVQDAQVPPPETNGMMCCATNRGWRLIVATQGTEVFLLNPITRARIQLHPLLLQSNTSEIIQMIPFPAMMLATVSSVPWRCYGIFCCWVGDPCWTMVNIHPHTFEFADAMYYNGFFYLLYKGALAITDANKPEEHCLCFLEKEFQEGSMFFLNGKSGVYVVAVPDIEEEKGARQKDEDGPAADEAKCGY